MLAAGVGVVVALVAVIVIAFSSSGPSSSAGCIYATIPGSVGAQQISQCGAQARETCASARRPGAFTAHAADVLANECRKAGLPVGG